MKRLNVLWLPCVGSAVAVLALSLALASSALALKATSEQKLIPVTAQDGDEVGSAIALDGGRAAIGAAQDSTLASSSGAVHVYDVGSSGFSLNQTLTASDGVAGDELGNAVDLDGDTLVAGAYHRWTTIGEPGRAYVYEWNGTSWVEVAKLTAPGGVAKDAFGWAVVVDGDFLAVGAPRAWTDSPTGGGKVYTYQRIDGVWTYDTTLSRGIDHSFGWSLAMQGNTLIVGSHLLPYERVTVYVRDTDGNWGIQATLDPPGDDGAEFGNSVAFDDNNLVVGAWFDTAGGHYGSAYFYHRTGLNWIPEGQVLSPDGERNEWFGEWTAIQGDLAIITDSGLDRDDEFTDMGIAYLYRHVGSKWSPAGRITPSDYATYTIYFGTAVALDAGRILVGAPWYWDEASESAPGTAYAYEIARGSKLIIKNGVPDNEFKNRIVFRGKGLFADVPFPGSADDPTCGGGASASIEVTSSTSGQSFVQALPCANWKQTAQGYEYRDPERDDGACNLVSFAPGGTSKANCSGAGPSVLNFDIEDGQPQLPIGVKLTLGTTSYCTSFGGSVKADGTDGKLFKSVQSGGMAVCTGP